MKHPEIQQIIDTMKRSDYNYEAEIIDIKNRQAILPNSSLTLSNHVQAMIYAQLSNNRPWEPIESHRKEIDSIFDNYNITFLQQTNPEELVKRITAIHCGNRQIRKQMNALHDNIKTLEMIEQLYGNIDAYYHNTPLVDVVKSLSHPKGKFKLKYMGIPLVCEYLKGVGVDVIKPDTHLCRLLGRLGYSQKIPAASWEAIKICQEIGHEYGLSQALIDTILWQYCADGKFEVCTAAPKCTKCGVKNCHSRKA